MRNRKNASAGEKSLDRRTGFLLLNSALQPLYVNEEAMKIIGYPAAESGSQRIDKVITKIIQSLTLKTRDTLRIQTVTHIKFGRRDYTCRLLPLSPLSLPSGDGQQGAMALLIERATTPANLTRIAEEFKLTQREYEAVQYLALGLTSKEISARMGISPNTVKAFLRLVMIKTGVTTRSGIIGKLLKTA
jgi:DNA-binding CsgD family transcriptional regulator